LSPRSLEVFEGDAVQLRDTDHRRVASLDELVLA
jgi:hypothetical protein